VGSVIGGFLARTGHDVTLLGRSWHLDAVEKNGLTLTGIWGDYRIKALSCHRSAVELEKKKPFDLIFLTVKSYDTRAAMKEVVPLMSEATTLISLQNGLGNIEAILDAGVKPENYLAGRVIFGVETQPGVAKITVNADDVLIGALPGVETRFSAFQAARLLSAAKVPARAVPDILTGIWAKVIYNCALNAICSLHEMPYGRILESGETRHMMERVVRECYSVGRKKGIVLDPPDADAFIRLLTERLIPSTAAHYPSMLQDLKRGKRTDIDALNGAIVRYATQLGVEAPENEKLAGRIRQAESVRAK
jgi:2-dehydropantoate 2-reductase